MNQKEYDVLEELLTENYQRGYYTGVKVGMQYINAIPIPNGATNGDMLKALYPNGIEKAKCYIMRFETPDTALEVSMDWWKAKYDRG